MHRCESPPLISNLTSGFEWITLSSRSGCSDWQCNRAKSAIFKHKHLQGTSLDHMRTVCLLHFNESLNFKVRLKIKACNSKNGIEWSARLDMYHWWEQRFSSTYLIGRVTASWPQRKSRNDHLMKSTERDEKGKNKSGLFKATLVFSVFKLGQIISPALSQLYVLARLDWVAFPSQPFLDFWGPGLFLD